MDFTWSDKEDDALYKNGVTIMWVDGCADAIQNFVEKLSYKIGSKCDFSFTAGRAHIDVFTEAVEKAKEAINDNEFMSQFLVSYSDESNENRKYFQVIG